MEIPCIYCSDGVFKVVDHFFYKDRLFECTGCKRQMLTVGEYDEEICISPELMREKQEQYLKDKYGEDSRTIEAII